MAGLAVAAAAAAGTVLYLRPPVNGAVISPPPPARVEGSVQVDSEPAGARILLDGSPTGLVTPATITPVSLAQEHKLRLERDGFQPKEVAFTLTEQMAQKAVSAGLMPVVAEEPPAAKEPEPEPARPSAKAGHAMGMIQLSSQPVAEVLYQKKAMGKTPAKLRLPVGKVELVLVNRELALTRKVEVDVPRSGVGAQEIAFRKGKLAADVKPWADVYVGAKKLGTTPFAPRELYEGTYVVKLVNSELGAIKEVQVTVTPLNGSACPGRGPPRPAPMRAATAPARGRPSRPGARPRAPAARAPSLAGAPPGEGAAARAAGSLTGPGGRSVR